jgi:hypothetical protein
MSARLMSVHLIGVYIPLQAFILIAEIINSRSYLRCSLPVRVTCPESPRDKLTQYVTGLTGIAGVYRQNTGSTTEMVQPVFHSVRKQPLGQVVHQHSS